MAVNRRAQRRAQLLRWGYIAAAVLIVLMVLFVLSGNWVWAIIFALAAAVAIWYVRQVRAIR
jgi:hypothetical protein